MQRPDKDSFPGRLPSLFRHCKGDEIKSEAAVYANSSNKEIGRVSAESPRSSGDASDEVLVLFTSSVPAESPASGTLRLSTPSLYFNSI
jgi:hypothetical protein